MAENCRITKKIVRLKNGKYIEVENPLFSGLKSQLPDIYCNQEFWDTCNKIHPNIGSDYQKRIAIVQIGRKIQSYPILKWQIVNKWPFIARRFTLEQLQALEKAANCNFDLSKPISQINRPPSISVPNIQVNHELQNGLMRLVSVEEHDGISKNPHAGGMRLNNPEGFSQMNFKKGDFEKYKNQNIKNPLYANRIYNSYNYAIASIVKFWKPLLFVIIIILIILFAVYLIKWQSTSSIHNQDVQAISSMTVISRDSVVNQHCVARSVAFFEFDSDYVKAISANIIDDCIAICKSDSTLKMIIYGYTCDVGSEEYNQILSEHRAKNIKDLLIARYPFMQNRIEIIGWGEKAPDSLKFANKAQNRRVDIEIKH